MLNMTFALNVKTLLLNTNGSQIKMVHMMTLMCTNFWSKLKMYESPPNFQEYYIKYLAKNIQYTY